MNQKPIACVPLPLLEAAALCAAKKPDDTAQIDSVALSKGHIVALDGTKMFYCPIANLPKEVNIVTPLDVVKSVIQQAKNNDYGLDYNSLEAEFSFEDDQVLILISRTEVYELFPPIGQYPQWYAAIPEKDGLNYAGSIPAFDWSQLVEFQKINKILGAKVHKQVHLKPTGENEPAHVYLYGNQYRNARGILMPLQA